MNYKNNYQMAVDVKTNYLVAESQPQNSNFAFSYTMTITNIGKLPARLLSRSWTITNAYNAISEIEGEGVVGQQPLINPGQSYQYTSNTVLNTPVGTMEGSYHLIAKDGQLFTTHIPPFVLAAPHSLH